MLGFIISYVSMKINEIYILEESIELLICQDKVTV